MNETDDLDAALEFEPMGGGGPQVTDFIGTVLSVKPEGDSEFGGVRLRLIFEDLVIREAASPYDLPIYDLSVRKPQPNRWGKISNTTAYAVLRRSAEKVIAGLPSWRGLVGRRLHVCYTPEHKLYNRERGEYLGRAWEIMEVINGGVAPPQAVRAPQQAAALALALLDGRTHQQFLMEALKDAVIRNDGALTQSILSKAWIKGLEAGGKVQVDAAGVYHVA